MLRRNILLCALLIFMAAFNSIAFATQPPPYASIVAYNANANYYTEATKPEFSTLGVLDIINMTPWDISLGSGSNKQLFSGKPGIADYSNGAYSYWESQWLAGFHKQPSSTTTNFGGNFAYHSIQIALNNLNNVWVLNNNNSNSYMKPLYYDTIPIIVNSPSSTSSPYTQGLANTANLTFAVTSAQDFTSATNAKSGEGFLFPATALSFGDGTNNYGWENANIAGLQTADGYNNTTHFLTVFGAGLNTNQWQPITKNLGGVVANNGTGGLVQSPNLLTVAGLIFPNFSNIAKDGMNLDLVVILQAGGYGDMQLLFLAIPNSNDSFLPQAGAVRR